MKRAYKILTAAGVLALAGGTIALVHQPDNTGATAPERPGPPPVPAIALGADDARALTRLEIERPDDDASGRRLTITLDRRGDGWEMTAPILTEASAAAVAEAVTNLER